MIYLSDMLDSSEKMTTGDLVKLDAQSLLWQHGGKYIDREQRDQREELFIVVGECDGLVLVFNSQWGICETSPGSLTTVRPCIGWTTWML